MQTVQLSSPASVYSRRILLFGRGTPLMHLSLPVDTAKPLIQDVVPRTPPSTLLVTAYTLPRTQKSVVLRRTGLVKPVNKKKHSLFRKARSGYAIIIAGM